MTLIDWFEPHWFERKIIKFLKLLLKKYMIILYVDFNS